MFDIGFSELLIIALVALVVLGPERLPKAARFTGLWVRRARAQWHSVKSEFERELADEELRRTLHDTRSQFEDAAETIREDVRRTGEDLQRQAAELRDEVTRRREAAPVAAALAHEGERPSQAAPPSTHAPAPADEAHPPIGTGTAADAIPEPGDWTPEMDWPDRRPVTSEPPGEYDYGDDDTLALDAPAPTDADAPSAAASESQAGSDERDLDDYGDGVIGEPAPAGGEPPRATPAPARDPLPQDDDATRR